MTTEPTVTDLSAADQLVMLKALQAGLTPIIKDVEARVLADAETSGASGFKTPHGKLTIGQSEAKPAILDDELFFDWVKTNRPDEIVTTETVRSSYRTAILKTLVQTPEGLMLKDGELPEWAGWSRPGQPYVSWPASSGQRDLKRTAIDLFRENAAGLNGLLIEQIEAAR